MKKLENLSGKILVLSLLIVQLATIKTHAQYFMVGPKAGLQVYGVRYQLDTDEALFDSKPKFGFNAGMAFNIPLTKNFNLNPELNFTQKGRKLYGQETGWTLNEVHYLIELPLILNYQFEVNLNKIGPIKNLRGFTCFLGAGPNISYFLGGYGSLDSYALSTDYEISFGGDEGDYQYITFSDVNRWQWGLDFNIGIISPLKNNKKLMTTFRYSYGHTQLGGAEGSTMPILGFSDNLAHGYRTLSLSFTYLFNMDLGMIRKGKSTKGAKIKTKNVGGPAAKPKNINKIKKNKN